jgi:Secretion system C-terminal sorting domain
MAKLIYILLFLFSCGYINAQKELWGTNVGDEYNTQEPAYKGNITKTDINGNNPEIVYEFDGTHGMFPKGRLFLASNGKLYGTAKSGGNSFYINPNISLTAGVLFEYDLILNKYRVVKYFDYNPVLPNDINSVSCNPQIGVIEPVLGKLYGATANRIYSYDFNTELVSFYNQLPYNNAFFFELMKASNGNLYGTSYISQCAGTNSNIPLNGNIIKFNTTTNNLSIVHSLNCDSASEGSYPSSQLVEVSQGKLYGSTNTGGLYHTENTGSGTLFEYNFVNNVFTRKIDFNQNNGVKPLSLINGGNGKIYGLCEEAGAPQSCSPTFQDGSTPPHRYGTLFEYTPSTNAIEIKQYFNYCGNYVRYPKAIIKTSLGNIIGSSYNPGYFKYDSNLNSVTSNVNNSTTNFNAIYNGNFIEVCRKPFYQEFLPNSYAPEQGTAFTFNVQNTNATMYVWKKGTTILPTQTTGILNLLSVTANDTGVYTCTMTNECGETVTMPLNINVTNLGTDSIDNYKELISLFPNPTKGIINLKFPENRGLKGIKYKITNLLGQVIIENDIAKNNTATSITIDTASFANGIYQVTLVTDKGNWNGKFVKE